MTTPGGYPGEPAVGTTVEDGEPAVPRGPGVAPPFPAPPTDRNRRGLWIGLGLGALALVVCCGGGLFGFGVILVNGTDQVKRQAQDVADEYYGALVDRDYQRAYELLCPALMTSEEGFAARQRRAPHPVRYELHETQIGSEIAVPVTVTDETGGTREQRVVLRQNRSTGQLKVCGGTD